LANPADEEGRHRIQRDQGIRRDPTLRRPLRPYVHARGGTIAMNSSQVSAPPPCW
jgi:hypothetical protein